MAVRARAQATLYDQTDPYNVLLTSNAYVFPGGTSAAKAGSCTTQILAYQGGDQVNVSVDVSEITKPAGITVSVDSDKTAPTLTITASTSFTTAGYVNIPVHVDDDKAVIHMQFSVSIALTGSAGAGGYSILCGNEAHVLTCDKDGKTTSATTITIPFSIFQGTSRKAATVTYTTLPNGMTLNKNTAGTTSAAGSLVIDVAAGSDLGGADGGEITLTFKTGSTTIGTKTFVWSKSITGATGGQGPQGDAAINIVCGNEAASISCTLDGKSKAAQDIVIPFAGYVGTDRAACSVAVSDLPAGITAGTNKAATASADGSLTLKVANNTAIGSATTYNGEITLTFTCNGKSFARKFAWSKAMTGATGEQGPQGDDGKDSIQIVIISSNGLVFRNTAIQTVLTAHVFVGGAEVTGAALADLGTINWYKDGSGTKVGTGASLTIGSGDVDHIGSYEAWLEN